MLAFKKAGADDDRGERQEEQVEEDARAADRPLAEGDADMTGGDEGTADQHCFPGAEIAVGGIATDHQRDVHQ
ncbi:hypothetical protein G432_05785 [Sphingomonas sp. MM-1]|nr:hypothetical protein [Sphingomonas sp. MM-1]AGH48884.1 hypothetical protein G432_05785 [Sphingomonas sp. MM-1]